MSVLHIVQVDCDRPTGYFVDDVFKYEIHCNDSHETADVIIDLMLKNTITEVRHYFMTDDGFDEFFGDGGYNHANNFSEYKGMLHLQEVVTANGNTYHGSDEVIV